MEEYTKMIEKNYGIKKKPITTSNPQENGILEILHQNLENMIKSIRLHDTELDKEEPWTGILGAVMFTTRVTMHNTNCTTLTQLVLGRDIILNVKHKTNCHFIKKTKTKTKIINN